MFPSPDWTVCHGAVSRPHACRHCLTPDPQYCAHAMFLGAITRPPASAWCPSVESLILRNSVSTINQAPFIQGDDGAETEVVVWRRTLTSERSAFPTPRSDA